MARTMFGRRKWANRCYPLHISVVTPKFNFFKMLYDSIIIILAIHKTLISLDPISIGVREKLDEMVVKQLVDIGCPEEVQMIERRHVDPVEALQVGQPFGQPRHVLHDEQKEIVTRAHTLTDVP